MLVFLNGADSYLAKKAIDEIKAKYLQKNSGTELVEINGDDPSTSLGTGLVDLQAVPLFATSRLAIIRRAASFSKDKQKDLAAFLGHLPSTTVAVVWDGATLVEGGELSAILQTAPKIVTVKPLEGATLRGYLKKYAAAGELTISLANIEEIISMFGADLWSLTGELDRLSLGGDISKTGSVQESEKFIYFRLLRNRSWQAVTKQLRKDFQDGVPIELTMGMLAAAIRKEVTEKSEKTRLTELLIDLDYGLKTGWLDAEAVTALLVAHLPKTNQKRVVWEVAWQKRGY